MSDDNLTKSNMAGWKPTHSYIIAALCLLLGIAAGYLGRGLSSKTVTVVPGSAQASASASAPSPNQIPPAMAAAASTKMTPQDLQQSVAEQVPPLLDQVKRDPKNAKLLSDIGNIYFDAHQYRDATRYYGRSLQIQPLNGEVRTDLGIAHWYLGNADRAIAEFHTVLKTEPNQPNALFDLGIVEWRGKVDAKAALAAWQKLLDTNPTFEGKDMVVRMMAETKQHSGIQPGTKTDKPAM